MQVFSLMEVRVLEEILREQQVALLITGILHAVSHSGLDILRLNRLV